jgi:phage terminase small subunit
MAQFVQEWLIDFDGGAAYKRAGYAVTNDNSARAAASRLLANVNVQVAIREAMARRAERTQTDADQVLRELALLAFSDIGQVLNFSGPEPRLRPACEISEGARRHRQHEGPCWPCGRWSPGAPMPPAPA